jgi:hypothetical protein
MFIHHIQMVDIRGDQSFGGGWDGEAKSDLCNLVDATANIAVIDLAHGAGVAFTK